MALVLLGGVNYLTGELMDIPMITKAGHAAGAIVGWDLAHAAGNVPLAMHDWDVDFAAWCSYKYLNAGPGALAGAFVHERHLGGDAAAVRGLVGHGGVDPVRDDAGVATARVRGCLAAVEPADLLDEPGPDVAGDLRQDRHRGAARAQSAADGVPGGALGLGDGWTAAAGDHTCATRPGVAAQLSLRVDGIRAGELARRLRFEYGVIADSREPDVLRLAPVPLYSTYHDCWRAASALAGVVPA